MADLRQAFRKETQSKKVILVSSLVVLVSTFLPWVSVSLGGFGNVSVNGWHSFGILTVLGSMAMILMWLLPKVGVKLDLKGKESLIEKIIVIVMLAGSVGWLINSSFEFGFMGIGFYLALIVSAIAVYFVFIGGKKKMSAAPKTESAKPKDLKPKGK